MMWDLDLGQEIILIIAMITLIAWFMGRTFCTSKEHEIRSKMKSLKKGKRHLESIIVEKDKDIHDVYQQLKLERKNSMQLAQQYDLSSTSLEHLTKEHKQTLKTLQGLQSYQLKFEQLSQHYDEISVDHVNVKNSLEKKQESLQATQKLSKKQQHDLAHYKAENKQMTQDYDEQVEQISTLKLSLKRANKNLQENEKHIEKQARQLLRKQNEQKQLTHDYDAQLVSNTELKQSLETKQNKLQVSLKRIDKQEKKLLAQMRENKALKKEIHTYKILSTIR